MRGADLLKERFDDSNTSLRIGLVPGNRRRSDVVITQG
jgi:hypothetical protein